MSKLLSQEEIDALLAQDLNSAPKEKAEEREYRLYDFKRADRVSKEQARFLRNIHENFAKLLSTYLSNTLRTMVEIKTVQIDQVSYLEFTRSVSDYTNLYIFEVEKLDGNAILEIDPNFTNFIIDKLFGGIGSLITRTNPITLIEESVMRNIAKHILKNFHEAWLQVDDLKPEITIFETNPQLVTIAPSSETILVLNFPVVVRNYNFYINLIFPYFMLEPVLKRMITNSYVSMLRKKITEEDRENLQHVILQTSVPVSVELGQSGIHTHEFLELSAGDIIVLDNKINQYILSKVAGKPKFLGVLGKTRKQKAFRIEKLLDDEGEVINEQA